MTTDGSLGIYYDRWVALDHLIADSAEYYRTGEYFTRRDTILHLLQRLQDFAAGQFQFFYFGYDPVRPQRLPEDPLLGSWDEFPAEDVLLGILDQIGHDLELIRRAADQRRLGMKNENVGKALKDADQLAWNAVRPAVISKVVEADTTVLTYFEKSAEFYRIPYASVALIAIPFTCTSTENHRDFLAIAHEGGHYVYRRLMKPVKAALKKELENVKIPAAYRGWISDVFEEMCADIYGCLIGGPVMALDFEGLSLANSQEDFRGGDGAHPNAAIRPFIYCQVLNSLSVRKRTQGNWLPIASQLFTRWDQQLTQRHVTDYVLKTSKAEGQNQLIKSQPYTLAETYHAGDPTKPKPDYGILGNIIWEVVDVVTELVLKYAREHKTPRLVGWAGKIKPETTATNLFDQYEREFVPLIARLSKEEPLPIEVDLSKQPLAYWEPKTHTAPYWRKWLRENNKQASDAQASQFWINRIKSQNKKKQGDWPPDEQILSGELKDPDKMDEGTWGYILRADGWALGGPSGNENGHPLL